MEEVELHYFGDAEQECGIKRVFLEDFIDMVAGAWNLAGEPAHAALVAPELLLDEVPDVEIPRIGALCSHKKNRELHVGD